MVFGVIILVVLAAAYVTGAWLSSSVILHPRRWSLAQAATFFGHSTPADFDLPFSDIEVRHDDIALRGWLVPAAGASSRAIVLIHRVGENRVGMLSLLPVLSGLRATVLLIDMRTHGESDGEVQTCGVRERHDVKAVVDWLIERGLARPGGVALVGWSLGAAVALQGAAVDHRVGAVVADGVYADLRPTICRFARHLFAPGFLVAPLAIWLAERRGGFSVDAASPLAVAQDVMCPVLLICGQADRLAPPRDAKALESALGGPTERWIIPRAGHCEGLGADASAYGRRVAAFLDRHLAR